MSASLATVHRLWFVRSFSAWTLSLAAVLAGCAPAQGGGGTTVPTVVTPAPTPVPVPEPTPARRPLNVVADLPSGADGAEWQAFKRAPVEFMSLRYLVARTRPANFENQLYIGWKMRIEAGDTVAEEKFNTGSFFAFLREVDSKLIASNTVAAALRVQFGPGAPLIVYAGKANGSLLTGNDLPASPEYVQDTVIGGYRPILAYVTGGGSVIGADVGRSEKVDSKILGSLAELGRFAALALGPLPGVVGTLVAAATPDAVKKYDAAISEIFSNSSDPQKLGRTFGGVEAGDGDVGRLLAFEVVLTEEKNAQDPRNKIAARLVFERQMAATIFGTTEVEGGKIRPRFDETAIQLDRPIHSDIPTRTFANLFGDGANLLADSVAAARDAGSFTTMCKQVKKNEAFNRLPLNRYDLLALPALVMKQAPYVKDPANHAAELQDICFSAAEIASLGEAGIEWPLSGDAKAIIDGYVNEFIFAKAYEAYLPTGGEINVAQTEQFFDSFKKDANGSMMSAKAFRDLMEAVAYANSAKSCIVGNRRRLDLPREINSAVKIGSKEATMNVRFVPNSWAQIDRVRFLPLVNGRPIGCTA